MSSLIGQQLGQYEITALLGKGGMATVYQARQRSINRDVAIKVIKPDSTGTSDFLNRFEREANTIAHLSNPHILNVFDYGQQDDLVYLVMELLKGGSLTDLVHQGSLPVPTALRVLDQVASALDYAHKQGIIHRDVKPQNVLLDEEGNAYLTDFGLAKMLGENSTLTQTGAVMGTPAYMSPEQWAGETLDARTDIYSLGIMLFEMVSGVTPFQAATPMSMMHQHIYEELPSLHALRPDLPPAIDKVIARAVSKKPGDRFPAAGQLVVAFKTALEEPFANTKVAMPAPKMQNPGVTQTARSRTQETELAETQFAQPENGIKKRAVASTTRSYTVFEYLGGLLADRGEDEPLLIPQLQGAILYKFPDFSFAAYEIGGLKEFLAAGEKAGYFKLVNTGNIQTSYLVPGTRQIQSTPVPVSSAVESDMGVADPRRTRWMTLTLEHMVTAERADQIVDSMKNTDALSPEFDAFIAAEIRGTPLYHVRGKLQRVREFLTLYKQKGESAATTAWQVSRSMLRLPGLPPVEGTATAHALVRALFQGNKSIAETPVESLDEVFFGVLAFTREQAVNSKSWDWAKGLEMLEAEARAVPRPMIVPKTALFARSKEPPKPKLLDEAQITTVVEQLRQAAGQAGDDLPTWEAFLQTNSLDASYRFLVERPKLATTDGFVGWLDNRIAQNVAEGNDEAVKNAARKAALVMGVRQFGLDGARQNSAELNKIYASIMEGAALLSKVFAFVQASDAEQAVEIYQRTPELSDESIGTVFEDERIKAAHEADVSRYRLFSERMDLWRHVLDFGPEEGLRQHKRFLETVQDDQGVEAEMGVLLLAETTNAHEIQEIVGRYPAVASSEALEMVTHTLDVLSFQQADAAVYNRYFEVKRLIERCLELGVDRALSELR
ncbi:MAG TPA: serine/threonine-protein kinase [Aggregatilineales bacterium]|nr:serine/threonine-protein kinase [Aggregatilineales bacterium]